MDSLKISRQFYDRLGAEGLADNTTENWDMACLENVQKHVKGARNILDVGCGYGRLSIPLAQRGYDITGIDISPVLIDEANRLAEKADAKVHFEVGSMTLLPYDDKTFDAAISIWSAFNELLKTDEQVAALSEMYRVLRLGGVAIIDSFPAKKASEDEIRSRRRYGPGNKISSGMKINNYFNPDFHHDKESIARLCQMSGIANWNLQLEKWGQRTRQVFTIEKQQ